LDSWTGPAHHQSSNPNSRIEGMPVVDDPISITRCTNKVFLMELLGQNQVATQPTVIIAEDTDLTRAMATAANSIFHRK
jgi:glutathione synthase/RimK-type ligase-like ATP-grasp enzyme